jgi:hypothetical protein
VNVSIDHLGLPARDAATAAQWLAVAMPQRSAAHTLHSPIGCSYT